MMSMLSCRLEIIPAVVRDNSSCMLKNTPPAPVILLNTFSTSVNVTFLFEIMSKTSLTLTDLLYISVKYFDNSSNIGIPASVNCLSSVLCVIVPSPRRKRLLPSITKPKYSSTLSLRISIS